LRLLWLYLEELGKRKDLDKIPMLFAETINGKTYITQATESDLKLMEDVQDLPEYFDVELNTKVDVGVFLGTFPTID